MIGILLLNLKVSLPSLWCQIQVEMGLDVTGRLLRDF